MEKEDPETCPSALLQCVSKSREGEQIIENYTIVKICIYLWQFLKATGGLP